MTFAENDDKQPLALALTHWCAFANAHAMQPDGWWRRECLARKKNIIENAVTLLTTTTLVCRR